MPRGSRRGPAAVIEGNTITGGPAAGISIGDTSASAAGIDPIVRGNHISGPATGIFLAPRSGARVEGNRITDAATGVSVWTEADGQLVGNVIEDADVGINVSDADPRISRNEIDARTTGLLLIASSSAVNDNLILGGVNGIVLSGPSTAPSLTANTVCGAEFGVRPAAGAAEPDLAGNTICGELVASR